MNKRVVFLTGVLVILIFILVVSFFLRGSEKKVENIDDTNKLVVVSPHPIKFLSPLIQEFENETGIHVEVVSQGTSDAIDSLVGDDNIDILWGGSVLVVDPYMKFFYPYQPKNEEYFKEETAEIDIRCTCFSVVPSVLMVNRDIMGDLEINGYEDLLDPRLKGKIAFADPNRSSSSFEHLVNMLYAMGEGDPEKGWDYVERFIENLDGNLLESSAQVYEGVANGEYVVGLTFEEAAVTMIKNEKHISVKYMKEGVISTPDAICINKNSKRLENAKKFVDFMTSKHTQNFMACVLGRRSVRRDVDPSSLVISDNQIENLTADKEYVVENKDKWIEKFENIFMEKMDE